MADMALDKIDIKFVPRPRPSVVSAPVGSGMVVVDSNSGMVHSLDAVAALVWQCFDGEATLEEITADLADGFDAPLQDICRDVVGMVKAAGRVGLLEELAEDGPPSAETPTGLREGVRVLIQESSHQIAGKQCLLVNWSAHCGFCVGLIPVFSGLQSRLNGAGTEIVLVDDSTPDDTDALLVEHSLHATVVVRAVTENEATDVFQGLGTPVAYWIDEEGRVASGLAYGADAVMALARSAAGVQADGEEEGATVRAADFLPVGAGVCGSASRRSAPNPFQPTAAYEIGSFLVGIRASSPWAEEVVAGLLAKYRLPDSVAVPDNFSVMLSDGSASGRRDLSLLLAGTALVARTRSPQRLMWDLAGHLSCLYPPDPGLHRLDAIGAVLGEEAVLLPKAVLMSHLEKVQGPLARMGLELAGGPFAHVDLESCELVVVRPQVEFDDELFRALPNPDASRSEPSVARPGRYPIKAWLMPSATVLPDGMSPAGATSHALSTLVCEPGELAMHIQAFASLLEGVHVVPVATDDALSVVESLRRWIPSRLVS